MGIKKIYRFECVDVSKRARFFLSEGRGRGIEEGTCRYLTKVAFMENFLILFLFFHRIWEHTKRDEGMTIVSNPIEEFKFE